MYELCSLCSVSNRLLGRITHTVFDSPLSASDFEFQALADECEAKESKKFGQYTSLAYFADEITIPDTAQYVGRFSFDSTHATGSFDRPGDSNVRRRMGLSTLHA